MVTVLAIVERHCRARFRAAVDKVLAAIDIKHRHAALGEGEVVGPVVIARFRIGVGRRNPAIGFKSRFEELVELRFARPDHRHVLARSGNQEGIHIDAADRLVEREDRVRRVIIGAEKARFLCRNGEEHQRAARRSDLGVRFGQSDQGRRARGVVDCAIADVVTVGRCGTPAQVVPVRGVDDVFVRRFRTGKDTDHILRFESADVVRKAGRCFETQRHRLEALLLGSGEQLVGILSCSFEDLATRLVLHPAVHDGERRRILAALGIGLRPRPAAFDHVPTIRSRLRIVDDDRSGSALAGSFFIFIGPAAVIGHGLAVEGPFQAFGAEIGIVDEDHGGLAGHVDAFVIVPATLGRVDAIAHEDQLAVFERGLRIFAIGHADPVTAVLERDIGAFAGNRQRREVLAGNFYQRHFLHPRAVVARLQPGRCEPFGQQGDGLFLADRAGHAAFEFVGRQMLGNVLHRLLGNVGRCDIRDIEPCGRPFIAAGGTGRQEQRTCCGQACADHGNAPSCWFAWRACCSTGQRGQACTGRPREADRAQ